jgi:diguanylate cyclase (GGDEF)-like protein/PAS domain S-box-containing protein
MTPLDAAFCMDFGDHPQQVDNAGVFFTDRTRTITYWNDWAEQLTGYSSPTVLGQHCWDNRLCHIDEAGRSLCTMACPLIAAVLGGDYQEARVYMLHHDGHRQPVHVWTGPRFDERSEIVGAVQVFTDATEPRRTLGAHHTKDPLTGLGDGQYVRNHLSAKLKDNARYSHPFGVLVADIDCLEQTVNRPRGKDVGNETIAMVARTLTHSLRGDDVVGRSDGDEFMIVLKLKGVGSERLHSTAERLRGLVAASRLPSSHHNANVTISIGGTLATPDDQVGDLLARARTGLAQAKRAGRNRVVIR